MRSSVLSFLVLLLAVLGVGARVWGYITAGPLWLDELFLVNNLRELSFGELLSPLAYGQNAPALWLWIEKASLSLFGDGEWALRLPALVASTLSIPLALFVARRAVGAYAIIPFALVCASPFVIWQAYQVKQYSFDLFLGLAIVSAAIRVLETQRGLWLGVLATLGFVSIWISMPSIFVLAGVGLVLFWRAIRSGTRAPALRVASVGALWCAAFAVNFAVFLRAGKQEAWLYEYWAPGFFPWPIEGTYELSWLVRVLAAAMSEPVGFYGFGTLALVPVVIGGCAWAARLWAPRFEHPREHVDLEPSARIDGRAATALVAIPLLLTFGAAVAGLYPFLTRLVLFLVPSLGVLLAYGIRASVARFGALRGWLHGVAAALLSVPLALCLLWLPRGGLPIASDTRGIFRQLESRAAADEPVLLEHLATYAWRYYGDSARGKIHEVEPAWNPEARVAALRAALLTSESSKLWFVACRVTREDARALWGAIRRDLGARDASFSSTYRSFVADQTRWMPLAQLEAALPPEWRIVDESLVYGACLWRLERD